MKIGIIGGSGLDDPKFLKDFKEIEIKTKYGMPSSKLTLGKIGNKDVVILSRHSPHHTIMPSNVNYRANIDALKQQNVTHLIVSTACGSLKKEIKPCDLVFLDQFIDRTTKRISTFYEDKVCHIPMAEPFCNNLRNLLIETAKELKLRHHEKGTVVTIEGPRFSTKAESNLYRQWNCDVINMSIVPEVVLAREAGMCYAAIASSTDYDCWFERDIVSWQLIVENMKKNSKNIKNLILKTIPKINYEDCGCREFIKTSIV